MIGGRNQTRVFFVPLIILYVFLSTSTLPLVTAQNSLPGDSMTGPFLDKIRYIPCYGTNDSTNEDEWPAQVQALVDGDVDILSTQHHLTEEITALVEAPNVEIVTWNRSGFWDLQLNCDVWPLNITKVRQALHYAIDKNALAATQGFTIQDCTVVYAHPLSIESEMDYHYYDADVERGAAILDTLGFLDVDSDGKREGPHGEEIPSIEVKFYRGEGYGPVLEDAANLVVDAFENLNLSAYTTRIYDWGEALYYDNTLSFEAFAFGLHVHRERMDIWAHAWDSSYPGWYNSTFDSLANIVRFSLDYDEITDAVKQMQQIQVEEALPITLVGWPLFTAYRTDVFDGIVNHPIGGSHNWLTGLRSFNASANSTGYTLRWATTHEHVFLDAYTSYPTRSYGIGNQQYLMEMMHDSLGRFDENYNLVNWLAKDWFIESHDDDPNIPEGYSRITVEIVDNATWSDGTPLRAWDVSYSFEWFRDNYRTLNTNDPWSKQWLPDIEKCVLVTPTQLQVYFSRVSYWNWYTIAILPIIPSHAREQYSNPLQEFNITTEQFNDGLITSGPFMTSEWVPGEYIEVVQNPFYWKNPRLIPPTTTPEPTSPPDYTMLIVGSVIGAASVIIVGGVVILKKFNGD